MEGVIYRCYLYSLGQLCGVAHMATYHAGNAAGPWLCDRFDI